MNTKRSEKKKFIFIFVNIKTILTNILLYFLPFVPPSSFHHSHIFPGNKVLSEESFAT